MAFLIVGGIVMGLFLFALVGGSSADEEDEDEFEQEMEDLDRYN